MTNGEITKVAGGVVEGLKAQPALLVIVVLNVVMLVAQVWNTSTQQGARADIVSKLIDRCGSKGD